jgi:hypothetical protein
MTKWKSVLFVQIWLKESQYISKHEKKPTCASELFCPICAQFKKQPVSHASEYEHQTTMKSVLFASI